MQDTITITINGKEYKVKAGQTIMQAADSLGFHIPRLCYHPKLSIEGACRVCIVEVEGMKNFVASCAFPINNGIKIKTNTAQLRRARRDIVELILDNHPQDCHICERDGNCELQHLAYTMGIRKKHFEGQKKNYDLDLSSASVIRDPNKCILCGRCVRMCTEIQGVSAIDYANRGFDTVVMPAYNQPLGESVCSHCGQCINICPTAAFVEKNYTQELFEKLDDESIIKVVQVAPAVRAAIGEAFGLEPGRNMEHETAAALRKLGFNYVFDTQFSADLTIMEEASEFLERVQGKGKLPLITSCCPGWINCAEKFYPEMLENISTSKSPMSMMSPLLKTYFAQKQKIDPEKIFCVAVMPCTAKKCESERPEHTVNDMRATDLVITTRELAWMIKSAGIDFVNIAGEAYDKPCGMSSGAATIFGVTGGVMEAAVRTAYELYTGETMTEIELEDIRGLQGIKEGQLTLEGQEIRIAVAHGLGNAHKLLKIVKQEPDKYHFIEIMACPGGCIGGGGQPYPSENLIPLDQNLLNTRAKALYESDRKNTIRRSHENPEVQRLYREFLKRPLSDKSHELLHTHYKAKQPQGIVSHMLNNLQNGK
ncbi:MAG: iron hydrogenase small subunit [Sedimentisphaerales bacterium]|nr:iron hydrogenase small subunit [Sedimentisphaerales bacterium]